MLGIWCFCGSIQDAMDFFEASSIPSVLSHLRSQPINDIDGMLLSKVGLRKLLPFSAGLGGMSAHPMAMAAKKITNERSFLFFSKRMSLNVQSSLEIHEGLQLHKVSLQTLDPQKVSKALSGRFACLWAVATHLSFGWRPHEVNDVRRTEDRNGRNFPISVSVGTSTMWPNACGKLGLGNGWK